MLKLGYLQCTWKILHYCTWSTWATAASERTGHTWTLDTRDSRCESKYFTSATLDERQNGLHISLKRSSPVYAETLRDPFLLSCSHSVWPVCRRNLCVCFGGLRLWDTEESRLHSRSSGLWGKTSFMMSGNSSGNNSLCTNSYECHWINTSWKWLPSQF